MNPKVPYIFFFLILTSLGLRAQYLENQKRSASTFEEFDQLRNTDSTLWKIETDQIRFTKKDRVDSLVSQPSLDSIVWFMRRHPYTVIEIYLKKDDWLTKKYKTTVSAQKQTQSILDYLIRNGINKKRLLTTTLSSGPLLMPEDSPPPPASKKVQPKRTGIIWCSVRVLSEDYRDSSTRK